MKSTLSHMDRSILLLQSLVMERGLQGFRDFEHWSFDHAGYAQQPLPVFVEMSYREWRNR